MKTYNDLQEAIRKSRVGGFLQEAVKEHQSSDVYRDAVAGMAYYRKHNLSIESYQKFLYTLSGRKVQDIFSSNYKLKTLVFRRLVLQLCGYILANGIQADGKERLGAGIDGRVMEAAKLALAQGVAFGFWNVDHVEVFSFADTPGNPGFVPLPDEETSELRAGIRYWFRRVGDEVLFRATLYEEDGFSEWSGKDGEDAALLSPKRGYKQHTQRNEAFGIFAQQDENYSRLPIAVLWGNDTHESELNGLREAIDCYDLIRSGLANNIDEASELYWILTNTGGMDDVDLARFMQRVKTAHGAIVDGTDGGGAEAHTMNVPTEARRVMLDILRRDIYEDAQLLDVKELTGGDRTATEIQAAYQVQDNRAADFEYQLIRFLQQLGELAGIPGFDPRFTWQKVINQREQTEMVLLAAEYLDEETLLRKLPWLLPEEVDEILRRRDAEGMRRLGAVQTEG